MASRTVQFILLHGCECVCVCVRICVGVCGSVWVYICVCARVWVWACIQHPSSLPRPGCTGDIGVTPTEFSSTIKPCKEIIETQTDTSPACVISTPNNFLHLLIWVGCTPIGKYTPKYYSDLWYAGVHHPGNLIPPILTPEKLGCTPLTSDCTPGSIWTPVSVTPFHQP